MATIIIFGLISLCWLAMGFMMAVVPGAWQQWLTHSLLDPIRRYLWETGILLVGLFLVAGTGALQGRWLWVTLGFVAIVKALLLLSLSDARQRVWISRWQHIPAIVHRFAGVIFVALATLLAIDTIRAH